MAPDGLVAAAESGIDRQSSMRFAQLYKSPTPVISFELFPPKTEKGMLLLDERIPKLIELDPSFMTVT